MAQEENEMRKCLYNTCLSGSPICTVFLNNYPSFLTQELFICYFCVVMRQTKPLGEGRYPHLLHGLTQPGCCYLLLEEAKYFHFLNPVLMVKNDHISEPFCCF